VGPNGGRPADQILCRFGRGFVHTCLQKKGKAKAVEKVGGSQITWSVSHVARPTDHVVRLAGNHLMSYQLNQVGNPSLDSYKYPSTGGNKNTYHILEIPLVKIPFLV
jgi:hypothetical protein